MKTYKLVQVQYDGKELPERIVEVDKVDDLLIFKVGNRETGWIPSKKYIESFMNMLSSASKEGAIGKNKYCIVTHANVERFKLEEVKE